MANSFVKWCRAKILNGYKHMHVVNVEEGSGSRSDTETLVRACEEELLLTSCSSTPTPGLPPHYHHTHGPNPAYLTSGHTTTNTSTTRLSPGSHRGRTWQATFTNNNTINNNNNNSHNNNNPDMRPSYVEEVSCDVRVAAGEADRQEFSFTLYDFDGHGKVTKDDISGLVRTIYDAVGTSLSLPPSGSRTIRVKLSVAPENKSNKDDSQSQTGQQHEEREKPHRCCGEDLEEDYHRSHRRRRARRRSTSLQRHELLQIIQANMEKNNLYYTPLNRHHDHTRHDGHSQRRRKKHNGGCGCVHNNTGSPPDPAQVKARLMEPDCSCQHTHYHTHTHPVTSTTNNCKRHYRSRSHDLTNDSPHVFRYHLLDKTFQPLPPSNTPDQPPSPPNPNISHKFHNHQHSHLRQHHHNHHRSHSFDGGDTKNSSPRGRRPYRRSNSHQSNQQTPQQSRKSELLIEMSPHHNKHRHREADHARAMSQVVAWLERGSLLDSSLNSSNGGGSCDTSNGGQTNHVHQHIHHHYHHYNEANKPISPMGDQQTVDMPPMPHLLI